MEFGYTILYVKDVVATLEFYAEAFGIARKMLHNAGDYGELETGSTTLAFASHKLIAESGKKPTAPIPTQPTFEVAFTTDNVKEAVTQAVDAGATLIQAPTEMPWGQTVAYVQDINGFLVEICTPIAS